MGNITQSDLDDTAYAHHKHAARRREVVKVLRMLVNSIKNDRQGIKATNRTPGIDDAIIIAERFLRKECR